MVKVMLGIISVTLIWGYTWVAMKVGIHDIPPLLFSGLRLFIGAVPLFLILFIQRKKLSIQKEHLKSYIIMSLLMGLGYMGILTYGMQFVDSGKTSVLVYTMPIFVTVISHFTLNEKMNVYKTMGLVCGLFGLLFIFGKEMLNIDQSALFGELCVLAAALSWGIANVFSKLQFKHIDIIHMNAWHLMMGAVMLLVFSFIFEPVPSAEWTYQAVWSLLFNGLLSTGFTFVVWFWVLNQIQASKASMALMFVPVLALFFGWLQLHEQITINIILGALLICCGIFMNTFTFSRRKV